MAVTEESMTATWSSGMLLSREKTYDIRLSSITRKMIVIMIYEYGYLSTTLQ